MIYVSVLDRKRVKGCENMLERSIKMIKKVTCFIVDSFAWVISLCFVLIGLGLIKTNLYGTLITILFAFFISPMRRKLLSKYGLQLKRKAVWVIGMTLFLCSTYQIGNTELDFDTKQIYETEIIEVNAEEAEAKHATEVLENELIDAKKKEENGENRANGLEALEENTVEVLNDEITEEEKAYSVEAENNGIEEVKQSNNIDENELNIATQVEALDLNENSGKEKKIQQEEIESNLEIHFIDVGQGDATLLVCDEEAMLVDAGTTSSGTSIQLYLKKREVSSLKYLILTHPDEDHIGGADVIITKYDIDNVFMPNYEKDTKAYEEVINALEYRWMKWSTPIVGSTYSLGGATFTVIAPNRNYADANESSIGIIVSHGSNKFLFTGDAESEAENDIVNNDINLECNVFKAGHHGSRTSNSSELLKAATPEYVVISCGVDNSYGHPHAGPMNEFRSMGLKLFRTDEQGTIVVESDGNSLVWNTSPTDSWKAGEPTENSSSNQDTSTRAPVPTQTPETQPETEQIPRLVGNNYAVNGKNGKIHIVGACPATGTGKNSMKEPVYFGTYEEAEAYSIQYHPGQDKRKCGNCY